jgi:nitrite reductase/ring-hydroxylating ferredoxin subunit/uncharacterized membrane protein
VGLEAALQVIERQQWLDRIGDGVQRAIEGVYSRTGEAGQRVKDFLHGTWLGHPLHPVLTDVPLGAWTAALVLDVLEVTGGRRELRAGADAAVSVGIAGAVGAAAAGLNDWQHTEGAARRTGVAHGLLNASALLLYVGSLWLRKSGARGEGQALSALGFAALSASAYLGGYLVYDRRIGVNHAATDGAGATADDAGGDFVAVLPEKELAEGEPRRVEVNGRPAVLVRRGHRIHALAETCAHLGGPLGEGRVEADAIVCPWHGSRFALRDGRVLNGPSPYPQPCFETRVRAGQIEVRAAS